jgi:DNA-binding CsgD family transcriptional regulator/tetratricopeptide (TPR) repeat protein
MASLNLAQGVPNLGIADARRQFSDGRYSACLTTSEALSQVEGPPREAALVLRARVLARIGRPAEAIAVLTAELADFSDPLNRLEGDAQLALAQAGLNDFASADATLAGLDHDTLLRAPVALRSEVEYSAALVAWMKGDLTRAEMILRQAEDQSPLAAGKRVMLNSWIASKREHYAEQARLMLDGVEIVQRAETQEVGLLAVAARVVCGMAREVSQPGLTRSARELYDSIAWTEDLAVENFNAARTLGWALALQGTDNYIDSLRLLHRATALSPTPAWKVWGLLDRAAMKRYAGEHSSSSADLYEALELIKVVRWAETLDEERTGLLYAAELLAAVDLGEASALLAQFSQISEAFSPRLAIKGDRRLDAGRAYSTGVVQQAIGDNRKARQFFETAYTIYDEIGYRWRAARTALHLYEVSQDAKWHESARRQIRDYPQSWIASDIREASSGVGDEGWNRLTPRQREVFNALCEGMTAKRIAERLMCSPNTVRNHVHWIYQAFRVESQPALIAEARKRKLIS